MVKFEGSYFVIADGIPYINVKTSSEAIVALMATYYVFHIQWGKEVEPVYTFLQSEIMELKDDNTKRNLKLQKFLKLLDN